MSNEINETDIQWLLVKMESNLVREKLRIEKLQEQVNSFHAFLDNKVTQADDFLFAMEESLKKVKETYVKLGFMDASILEEEDEK